MAKSRNRKGHKQKVTARNERIKGLKKYNHNMMARQLMELINKEKENGSFDESISGDK